MHILDLVLIAFVEAKTLKVVRRGPQVWLSNGDGFPLNLVTGQIERIPEPADAADP
ncbi:MAG TPA: hypothetical protein VKT72_17300 [Candidatus Baltobacteraceae bacterium]|nr:hypothetical protein [Candidatus Baltobacteraceae bacterium]